MPLLLAVPWQQLPEPCMGKARRSWGRDIAAGQHKGYLGQMHCSWALQKVPEICCKSWLFTFCLSFSTCKIRCWILWFENNRFEVLQKDKVLQVLYASSTGVRFDDPFQLGIFHEIFWFSLIFGKEYPGAPHPWGQCIPEVSWCLSGQCHSAHSILAPLPWLEMFVTN